MTSNIAKIKLTDLLARSVSQEPRHELLDLIMLRILERKLKIIRLKVGSTALGLILTLLYVIFNWQAIALDLSQSAIWQLPRLLVTDFSVVLTNWQDYIWYAIESLPMFSIVILTIAIWLILESIKFASELFSVNKYKLKI